MILGSSSPPPRRRITVARKPPTISQQVAASRSGRAGQTISQQVATSRRSYSYSSSSGSAPAEQPQEVQTQQEEQVTQQPSLAAPKPSLIVPSRQPSRLPERGTLQFQDRRMDTAPVIPVSVKKADDLGKVAPSAIPEKKTFVERIKDRVSGRAIKTKEAKPAVVPVQLTKEEKQKIKDEKKYIPAGAEDVVKRQAGVKIYKEATPYQRKVYATGAFFSGYGVDLTAAKLVRGKKTPEDVIGKYISGSIVPTKKEKGMFVLKSVGGAFIGSPPAIVGTAMLGGAGITAIGATKTGAAVFANPAFEIGSATLVGVYGYTRGMQMHSAYKEGDMQRVGELGIRTGLEVGGFVGGAKAQTAYMLKKTPIIHKAVGKEQIQMRKEIEGVETIHSKGGKVMRSEYLGRKYVGAAKTQTVATRLKKPIIKKDFITEQVGITKGHMKTTQVPIGKKAVKSIGEHYITGTEVSPKTIMKPPVRFVKTYTYTASGKKIAAKGITQKIIEIPKEQLTVYKTGTAVMGKPINIGKDITFVHDIPRTETKMLEMFTGTKIYKPFTKPATTSVIKTPITKSAEGKMFQTGIKTLATQTKMTPYTTVGMATITAPRLKPRRDIMTKQKTEKILMQDLKKIPKQQTKTIVSPITEPIIITRTQTIPITTTETKTITITETTPIFSPVMTPTPPPVIPKPTYFTPMSIPPIRGAFGFTPIRRQTPRKRPFAYTPSLAAGALGIRFKKPLSAKKLKALGKKEFTGLEFRPIAKRSSKMRLVPKKRANIKKLFGFKI